MRPGTICLSRFPFVLLWTQKAPCSSISFSVNEVYPDLVQAPLLFPPLAQLPFYPREWGFPLRAATFVCCKDRRQIDFETAIYCITSGNVYYSINSIFFLRKHIQGLMTPTHQEALRQVYSFSRKSWDVDSPQARNLFCRQMEPPLHLIPLRTQLGLLTLFVCERASAFYFQHVMDCEFYKMQNQRLGCCSNVKFQIKVSKCLFSLSIPIAGGDGSWAAQICGPNFG